MTSGEEQRFHELDRIAMRSFVWSSWLRQVAKLKERAKSGPLHRLEFKMLDLFAKRGVPGAQELVDKRTQIGVKERKSFGKIVRANPRREGEAPSDWVRRIWSECDKYETNCPQVLSLEHLERLAGQSPKTDRNLPLKVAPRAKSFESVEGGTGNSAKVLGGRADAQV